MLSIHIARKGLNDQRKAASRNSDTEEDPFRRFSHGHQRVRDDPDYEPWEPKDYSDESEYQQYLNDPPKVTTVNNLKETPTTGIPLTETTVDNEVIQSTILGLDLTEATTVDNEVDITETTTADIDLTEATLVGNEITETTITGIDLTEDDRVGSEVTVITTTVNDYTDTPTDDIEVTETIQKDGGLGTGDDLNLMKTGVLLEYNGSGTESVKHLDFISKTNINEQQDEYRKEKSVQLSNANHTKSESNLAVGVPLVTALMEETDKNSSMSSRNGDVLLDKIHSDVIKSTSAHKQVTQILHLEPTLIHREEELQGHGGNLIEVTTADTSFVTEIDEMAAFLMEESTITESLMPTEATVTFAPTDEITTVTNLPQEMETAKIDFLNGEVVDTIVPIIEESTIIPIYKTTDSSLSDLEESFEVLGSSLGGNRDVILADMTRTEKAHVLLPQTVLDGNETSTGVSIIRKSSPDVSSVNGDSQAGTFLESDSLNSSDNKVVYKHVQNNQTEIIHKTNGTAPSDILLEASPNLGIPQISAEVSLEPTSFDVKIKTIKDLQVDVHDAIFDPSEIAKATSYEESSYSTATRSATVTTWVDPNSRVILSHGYANLTNLKDIVLNPMENSQENLEDFKVMSDDESPVTGVPNINHEQQPSTGHPVNVATEMNDSLEITTKESSVESTVSVSETVPLDPNSIGFNNPSMPFKVNTSEHRSVNGTSSNKMETPFVYEMPDISRGPGPQLAPSVIIALSICCSVIVLISLLTVSLWFFRRHKNRSKIYLSRDAARPRAFFTKPMNPALLPDERPVDLTDAMYIVDFQKPRAPVVLSDDPDCVLIDGESKLKSKTADFVGGIENQAFVDIPLEEIAWNNCPKTTGLPVCDPPKISSKSNRKSETDSGIRVWSSTGSLFSLSPESSHCTAPPPPYSSSIPNNSTEIDVDPIVTMDKKSRFLFV